MYHNPTAQISPEMTALLAAKARVEAALAAQSECIRKLRELDQVERSIADRRPTLLGVAPQAGYARVPFQVAAGLGKRPSGRY